MEAAANTGIKDYLSVLHRRREIAMRVGLGVFAVALVLCFGLPTEYRSSALFQLRAADQQQLRDGSDYADRYVSALTNAVLNRENRRAILNQLPLYPDLKDSPGRATARLQKDLSVAMVTEKILDPQSGREREINTGFTVAYDNPDPVMAQKGAAWYQDAFFRVSRLDAANTLRSQSKFLTDEAERTRQHISQLEVKLAEFKKKNFDNLPESAQTNMNFRSQAEQELNSVERDMRALQQNRIFLQQQLQQARAANPDAQMLYDLQDQYHRKLATYDENHPDMVALRRQIDSLRRGTATAGMPSLKEQLATQKAILAETRQRYSDEHPDVKRLKRDIASLESRVASGDNSASVAEAANETAVSMQLQTQIHATDTQLAALQSRSTELRKKMLDLDSRLASTPQVEQDYEGLTRDLGTARQQYDQLLGRRMEIDVQASSMTAGTADKFRVIEHPLLPETPAKPKRMAIAILGLVAGIMLAFISAFTAEIMDGTVRGSDDVRKLLDLTPLAVIPDMTSKPAHWWRSRHVAATTASLFLGIPLAIWIVHLIAS